MSRPSVDLASTTLTAPVVYIPDFIGMPRDIFERLLGDLPWSRAGSTPRDECYFNDTPAPYTYGHGRGQRTYLPEPSWHPAVMEVRAALEADLAERLGCRYNLDVCFCNMYTDQFDQLGWHADDSPEMDDARPVVTVSLGAERDILLRPRGSKNPFENQRVRLASGSALVMLPGMQDTWDHRIPKHDRPCGPRISLTFRGFVA